MKADKASYGKLTTPQKRRNKKKTVQAIMDATRTLIETEGIANLQVNKIAKMASRSRRLIYDYFGGLDGILKTLLSDSDIYLSNEQNLTEALQSVANDHGQEFISLALKRYFDQIRKDKLLSEVALSCIVTSEELTRSTIKRGEEITAKIYTLIDQHFKYSEVDLRSISALLLGGINYIVLHARAGNETFCGIDLNDSYQQRKIKKSIEQVIKLSYETALNSKKSD